MSDLGKRIAFAVPAAALFLVITWIGGWYFKGMILLLALFIIKEHIGLFQNVNMAPDLFFPYTIGVWVLLAPELPYPLHIGLIIFLLFIILQLHKSSENTIHSFASTLFTGIYAPLGLLAFMLIRTTGTDEQGFMLALSLLLMVWGNDVFAYFGGKYVGKHKLAPKISPKKTWEGFVFGVLGAAAGFLIVLYLVPLSTPLTLLQGLLGVVIVSLLGPIGDLTVSKMKRAANQKDTSDLLPGHGGLFDRFDALILAASGYYLLLYGLQLYGYVTF